MRIIKTTAVYISVIAISITLIMYADTTISSAQEAVKRCLNILIPSIFVFMAVSGLLVRSGAYKIISLPFYPIARFVFRMPYELFSVMLISNLAGFPVGASMLCELVKSGRIDKKTASIMQCFCYGGGPSFSAGVIGLYLYNDKKTGLIVCLSAFAANMLTALVLCRIYRLNISDEAEQKPFSADDIISCTENAGRSMLMICALIIIFCVVMSCAQRAVSGLFHIHPQASALIRTVFEVSSITSLENARLSFLPMITALFSFGGVCVLMQIVSTVKNSYSLTLFFITRLPTALLSGLSAKVLCSHLLDKTESCIAVSKNYIVNFNNFIPSICLILMIFLLLFKKGVAFFRDI